MTTIVYYNGILAADTQLTTGIVKTRIRKIEKLPDGRIMAQAGNAEDAPLFAEWLMSATTKKKKIPTLAKGFEVIVLEDNGHAVYYNSKCIALPVEDPIYTNGSGWAIARAGIICGLTAKKAVELAGQIDQNTNTLVDTYDIKTKRLTLSKFT